MAANHHLKWAGDAVKKHIAKATAGGINETMADAVSLAKGNHPDWQNRTSAAEGSVRIQSVASAAQGVIEGRWGSTGIHYVEHLEFWHGSFLRNAADEAYQSLKARINRRL